MGKVYNQRIRDRICALAKALGEAKDAEEFKYILTQFYKEFGFHFSCNLTGGAICILIICQK